MAPKQRHRHPEISKARLFAPRAGKIYCIVTLPPVVIEWCHRKGL